MYIKVVIGKWLSVYYDRREEIAFKMPVETKREQEDAVRFINYNIPHKHRVRLEEVAFDTAGDFDEDRLFRVYSNFYLLLLDYKIDRILDKVFGLI